MRISWEYIAGFFDGEGCIGVGVRGPALQVSITQKRREVLDLIVLFLAARGIKSTVYQYADRCAYLKITNRKASVDFLRSLLPFLVVKRVAAMDAVRLWKLLPPIPRGYNIVEAAENRRCFVKQ